MKMKIPVALSTIYFAAMFATGFAFSPVSKGRTIPFNNVGVVTPMMPLLNQGVLAMVPKEGGNAEEAAQVPEKFDVKKFGIFFKKSVVLTGATGFVGLRTLKSLLMHTNAKNIIIPVRVKDGSMESALKRFSTTVAENNVLGIDPDHPAICVVPMEAEDNPSEDAFLKAISRAPNHAKETCTTVIHLAACTDWTVSAEFLLDTNLKPTMGLLKGVHKVLPNIGSFLYCSTAYAQPVNKLQKPIPEGPLAPLSPSNEYFSPYGHVKATTEAAIHDWAIANNNNHAAINEQSGKKDIRISIVRPSTVAGSIGLDNVPVGWVTDSKGLTGGLKLVSNKNPLGKILDTVPFIDNKGSNIIPVDYVANMIVLAAGNPNIPHFLEEGNTLKTPLYVNMCTPSALNLKWNDIMDVVSPGTKLVQTEAEYNEGLKRSLAVAKDTLGYSDKRLRFVKNLSKHLQLFCSITFNSFEWETCTIHTLHEGLAEREKVNLPIVACDLEEMKIWCAKLCEATTG